MEPLPNRSPALTAEIAPSRETLAVTLAQLERRLQRFADDGAGAHATIVRLDEVLAQLSGGPAAQQGWEFGALTLPVQAAWKAVTTVLGKVMTEATGVSFESWTGLLASGRGSFDDYLSTLRAVGGLSTAHGTLAASADPEADLALLAKAKLATAGWRTAMRPVADFARLLDSMMTELTRRLSERGEPGAAPKGQAAGWVAQLQVAQQRMGEAVDVAADKLHLARGDLLNLVLGPLQEVRGRAAKLPSELNALHQGVSAMEDLLDLLDAQIRTRLGQLPRGEIEIVSLLFAALVQVPLLNADLSRTRADIVATRGYLTGVARMIADKAVSEATARSLQAEFDSHIEAAEETLHGLEQRARLWQDEGAPLIGAGLGWAEREFEVANVRQAVGQWSPAEAEARRQYVHRHRQAMTEALTLIGGLNAGGGNVRTIPAAV